MLIRVDTFDKGECLPESRKVIRLRGGIFIHEHFLSLPSTHLHLARHAEIITDRSKAHNILLGGGLGAAPTYTEDESVCSTATTETFDQRILWGITCDSQKSGIGSYHGSERHVWVQSAGIMDQISMSLLRPLPLTLIVPISKPTIARLQLILACHIAKSINEFAVARELWSRENNSLVKVKWPNDLGYVSASGKWRKIGGILVEPLRATEQDQTAYIAVDCSNDLQRITNLVVAARSLDLYFVISLGLNVNQCPPELEDCGFLRQALLPSSQDLPELASSVDMDEDFACIGDSLCVCSSAHINRFHLMNHLFTSLTESLNGRALNNWARDRDVFYSVGDEIICMDESGLVMSRGKLVSIDIMEGTMRIAKKDGELISVTPRTIRK